jgi:hypothetical protein
MNRDARSIAVVAALATLLTGCDGGTPTNGLEEKSAAQVQQDAAAAIRAAKSVHVTGTTIADGTPAQVDLRIQDGSSTGTITLRGAELEIIRVGDDAYVKGNEEALEGLGLPPEMLRPSANRWLKLNPQEVSKLEGFSLDSFALRLTTNESPLEPVVEQMELDGRRVVLISKQDGSRLYIANTGPAYPLRGESQGADAGRIDFSEYDVDFRIAAPSNYVEPGELAWHEAVRNMREKIDEPFMVSEITLTRAAMASFGVLSKNAVVNWLESVPLRNVCNRSTRSWRKPARRMTRVWNASTPPPVSATKAVPLSKVRPRRRPKHARSIAASPPKATAATSSSRPRREATRSSTPRWPVNPGMINLRRRPRQHPEGPARLNPSFVSRPMLAGRPCRGPWAG